MSLPAACLAGSDALARGAWTEARDAFDAVLRDAEIPEALEGKGLAANLFEHPLLSGLFLGKYRPKPAQKKLWVLAIGRDLPSYVPASARIAWTCRATI